MSNLAVIIPAYESLVDVMSALNSLRKLAEAPRHFHVQDDASPSVSFPHVVPQEIASCVRNTENVGFAANCNFAARGLLTYDTPAPDILFFCNQDVYGVPDWSTGWDTALLSAFDDPQVGIVGARLLFPDFSIQSVGGVFDKVGQPVHRCLGWRNAHADEVSLPREVNWTTGAALAIRADLFKALDGFDEDYTRGYFEDVDLCLRARELGWKVWFEPRCTLLHRVGSTGGSPFFMQNARRFRETWVDSGRIERGDLLPTFRWW